MSNKYTNIINELIEYYEMRLSSTIFWKNWQKSEGDFEMGRRPCAQIHRNHYASAIKTHRNKLRLAKQLKNNLEIAQ